MTNNKKGLKDIKTHAGRINRTFVPHRAFMRISCLEMEKAHRIKEKESALSRVEAINQRVQEIEKEQQSLLNSVQNSHCFSSNQKENEKPNGFINKKLFRKKGKGILIRY